MRKIGLTLLFLALFGLLAAATNLTPGRAQEPVFEKPTRSLRNPPGLPGGGSDTGISTINAPALNNWYRVVVQSYRTGNWEIFNPNYPVTNLTNHPSADFSPRLNTSLDRIVFVSDRFASDDIFVMNWDGSNLTRLTTHVKDDYAPDWSPDGTKIAFLSDRFSGAGGEGEVMVMNADGTSQQRLTDTGNKISSLAWSPDGRQIAFVRTSGSSGTLFIMGADGSSQHSISPELPYLGGIAWSPDNQWLAADYDYDGDGLNEIVAISSDGTRAALLRNPGTGLIDLWVSDWASNERYIAYTGVSYVWINDKLYLDSAGTGYLDLRYPPSNASAGQLSNFDMAPDVQLLDRTPPSLKMTPLPEFSRLSGFSLTWVGSDPGPAPSFFYFPLYRKGTGGEWMEAMSGYFAGPQNPVELTIKPPSTDLFYYLIDSEDEANNRRADIPWESGDGWTKVFTFLINGSVRDNRGTGLFNAQVSASPASWESPTLSHYDGQFTLHLRSEGPLTLNAGSSPLAPSVFSPLNVRSDQTGMDLVLNPMDNLLTNHGFESGKSGWTVSGTATITDTASYSGLTGVLLSDPCTWPCVEEESAPITGGFVGGLAIALDSRQYLHMIYDINHYAVRDPQHNWSESAAIPVTFNYPSSSIKQQYAFTVDEQDTLHLILHGEVLNQVHLFYFQKPVGGSWTPELDVTHGRNPILIAGDNGVLHLAYVETSYDGAVQPGFMYRSRSTDGKWSAPIQVFSSSSTQTPAMAVSPDGVVHYFFGCNYRTIQPNGEISETLFIRNGCEPINSLWDRYEVQIDSTGAVHFLWGGVIINEVVLFSDGRWGTPAVFNTDGFYWIKSLMDENDNQHFLGDNSPSYLFRSASGETRYGNVLPGPLYTGGMDFTLDSMDIPVTGWKSYSNVMTSERKRLSENTSHGISQQVHIPTNMHAPTLSLMYTLACGSDTGKTRLSIEIQDSIRTTQVLTMTRPVQDWQQAWTDLTKWSGQTITLTIALEQDANEPAAAVEVDHVSLGSWMTPVPLGFSPRMIKNNWAGSSVTILGENFIQSPDIYLGSHKVTSIQWINANQLIFTIPSGLSAGFYPVLVVNPSGQASILPDVLVLGNPLYIPLIQR